MDTSQVRHRQDERVVNFELYRRAWRARRGSDLDVGSPDGQDAVTAARVDRHAGPGPRVSVGADPQLARQAAHRARMLAHLRGTGAKV